MILLLGDCGDPLFGAIAERSGDTPVVKILGPDICSGAARLHSGSCLEVRGQLIHTSHLSGVVMRLAPAWWRVAQASNEPGHDYELLASWYSFLANLDCPVVNRFGLSWWLQDAGYRDQVLAHLHARMRLSAPRGAMSPGACYLVGASVVATAGSAVPAFLGDSLPGASVWQAESGILMSRIEIGEHGRIACVQPFPSFAGETKETVACVAREVMHVMRGAHWHGRAAIAGN